MIIFQEILLPAFLRKKTDSMLTKNVRYIRKKAGKIPAFSSRIYQGDFSGFKRFFDIDDPLV